MTQLFKVGSIETRMASSRLAGSKLWHQPVNHIEPVQLHAFIVQASLAGAEDQAVNEVHTLQIEVHKAVEAGQIVRPHLLDYERPTHKLLTIKELKDGLVRMTRARAQAAIFGLETKLEVERVIALTWPECSGLPDLTTVARNALIAQPRHMRSNYVFWEEHEGRPLPCFGLERDVFDIFGCVWSELLTAYKHMHWVDYEVELKRWQELLLGA